MLLLAEHRVILQWWYPGIQLISKDLGVLLLIATVIAHDTQCVSWACAEEVLRCYEQGAMSNSLLWVKGLTYVTLTTALTPLMWRENDDWHLSTKMNPMMTPQHEDESNDDNFLRFLFPMSFQDVFVIARNGSFWNMEFPVEMTQ